MRQSRVHIQYELNKYQLLTIIMLTVVLDTGAAIRQLHCSVPCRAQGCVHFFSNLCKTPAATADAKDRFLTGLHSVASQQENSFICLTSVRKKTFSGSSREMAKILSLPALPTATHCSKSLAVFPPSTTVTNSRLDEVAGDLVSLVFLAAFGLQTAIHLKKNKAVNVSIESLDF